MAGGCSGRCTRRRVYLTYLTCCVLQIITSLLRQLFDFLGPLWTLILLNFLTIVFSIFGFYGAYVRSGCCVVTHALFSLVTSAFNILIALLYVHPALQPHRSQILSLSTGALSYFETRAPGCVPDWAQNTIFNCYLDPVLVECTQASLQVFLGLIALVTGVLLLCMREEEKQPLSNAAVASPDLRPMTPRRVKRRSARSIQSSNYGRSSRRSTNSISKHQFRSPVNKLIDSETSYDERPGPAQRGYANRAYQNSSALISQNPGVGPAVGGVSSLHGSHRRTRRHQATALQQQHHPLQGPPNHWRNSAPAPPGPPPRPPSARSSYSNYHAARQMAGLSSGVANPSFDNSTEFFYDSRPVYPLAHSPVSQSDFPMQHGATLLRERPPPGFFGGPQHSGEGTWQQQQQQMMVAMGQVPTVSPGKQQNSETVI